MSLFLEQSDYNALISDTVLRQVIENSPALLDEAELMAQSEMESYLATRFDVGEIYSKTGTARNKAVVMYMIDITLYHLHSRVAPRNISQLRTDRYRQAIAWLNMCASGELSPSLPLRVSVDGTTEDRLRWGSSERPELRF